MRPMGKHNKTYATQSLTAAAVTFALLITGCGGEETEPALETTTEIPEPAPESPSPVAEAETPEQPEEPNALEAAEVPEPVELPSVDAPDYAAEPSVCVPHPDSALEVAIRTRDLSRGEPDFPRVDAINAACEHDPGELAETFNEGGLRRHRQRDYAQSQHYFASAVVLDPSQLSARFNLACAMARQGMIEGAIHHLLELEKAGDEGIEYAGRAQRDRDFGDYHGTPALAALVRGPPPVIEAITTGEDVYMFASDEEVSTYHDTRFSVLSERVWEHGALPGEKLTAFVLTLDPDRRRFRFFNDRPTDEARAVLEAMGFSPMLLHAGWTPIVGRQYLAVPVSGRDEDRDTLYLTEVRYELIEHIATLELPAVSCDSGAEAVRTFVESDDHRAFGYVTGCLDAPPHTFERCLLYFKGGSVWRRCGQGEAPSAEAEAAEAAVEGDATEAATPTP